MIPESETRILVAPSKEEYESVKQRIDFNFSPEGTYLLLGFACDCWRHPDDFITRGGKSRKVTRCGCDRSFSDIDGAGCTVGKVVSLSAKDFDEKFLPAFRAGKFYESWSKVIPEEDLLEASVQPIVQICQSFRPGTLVMIETLNDEAVEVFEATLQPPVKTKGTTAREVLDIKDS